ncbi:MAG: HlyC/CorC family transporter [Hydrogenophaga sp.]|uniref:HlyC/CorC family transporter n=1 Tax=Hydrogenophaga crocea TaxID=2716225 RepID=A0A6G8ID11_9BURK|nr:MULTISPECIES: hemolysin family protein [Hydrogenophaga]MBL0945200.1 HlyC/CorC family transporter [Hydrogenophaga sp.]QIM50890.1 HlyC/CorC family transporter [Hydrogenophaga crocea]
MDFVLIAFLTLLNGAFAMSELALASSRRARLGAMAEDGDKGAATALQLLEHPTQFLSSVQVGITSIGMLNGIVGEAAFSDDLGRWFLSLGLDPRVAGVLATALVVTAITFITIVFGELVPKRIGQLYPETVARWVSRPMAAVAQGAKPFVWLLTHTTQWVLKLLRVDNSAAQVVTEEEIKASLAEGVDAGIIEAQEHRMVRNVFGLDDRQLNSIMLPASEIEWLDARDSIDEALRKAGASGHSWYPVCRNGLEDVVGVIHVPQLLALQQRGEPGTVGEHVQPAVFVPETLSGMELLDQFRARATRLVFVVDEYGVVQGLLTPRDMLEAITGELSPEQPVDAWARPREDGAWEIDGAMPVAELKSRLDIDGFPDEDKGRYATVAGLMHSMAGTLLQRGEFVDGAGWRFEVVALDGRRIDRVLVTRLAPPADDAPPAESDG